MTLEEQLAALPSQIVIDGPQMDEALAWLKAHRGRAATIETVTGHPGQWRLRLVWGELPPLFPVEIGGVPW